MKSYDPLHGKLRGALHFCMVIIAISNYLENKLKGPEIFVTEFFLPKPVCMVMYGPDMCDFEFDSA